MGTHGAAAGNPRDSKDHTEHVKLYEMKNFSQAKYRQQ